MAAFSIDRLLCARTIAAVALFLPTSCTMRRRSIDLSETVTAMWSLTRAGLLFLWMLAVVALFFLVAAGAAGLLR